MSSVLVINKSCHDFTAAEKFGEVIFLSEGSMSRFNTSKMFRTFKPFIDASSPEDYLLLTGMTVMNTVAAAMFAAKHGRVNLLIWREHQGGGSYLEKVIVLN